MQPDLQVARGRCTRCQAERERACLWVNGIALCLRTCLRPVLDALEELDGVLWVEEQH